MGQFWQRPNRGVDEALQLAAVRLNTTHLLRVVFFPVTHGSAHRHEAWIGAFVIPDFIFGRAVLSQIAGYIFGKGREHLLFALAGPDSIAKPKGPAVDAFVECVEMR